MSSLKPANVLMEHRLKELTHLDRELRLLEGNTNETEGDEDENDYRFSDHYETDAGLSNHEMEQIK